MNDGRDRDREATIDCVMRRLNSGEMAVRHSGVIEYDVGKSLVPNRWIKDPRQKQMNVNNNRRKKNGPSTQEVYIII